MKSTAASLPPMNAWILQLPIAANSLRNYVNLEGTLGLSTSLYMMRLHPWSFPPSKRKWGQLLHILPPSDCDDPNRVGATRAFGSRASVSIMTRCTRGVNFPQAITWGGGPCLVDGASVQASRLGPLPSIFDDIAADPQPPILRRRSLPLPAILSRIFPTFEQSESCKGLDT